MPFPSCSSCVHAITYTVLSITLAVFAICSASQSHKTQIPVSPADDHSSLPAQNPSTNAMEALQKLGYNISATLLQLPSEHFLPPSQGTLFPIVDRAISNISLPPQFTTDFLHYHTSPKKLTFQDLLLRPLNSCIPTLLHQKNLMITKINQEERMVEINQVPISHPDIYTDSHYTIHGILAPFYSPKPADFLISNDLIPSPTCNENAGLIANPDGERNAVPWPQIIRLLGLNGFTSFSIGLQLVLDGILQDFGNLSSVTIFAPRDYGFSYIPSPSPLLEKAIRLHILPQKMSYSRLAQMPNKEFLPTLIPRRDLQITNTVDFAEILSINRVEVTEPDIFSTKMFVIHGVSWAFEF
ncbi:fasciclin-like arabinogalactan protein 21 [Magnolia sinica]|uniref:fasciclin-like arabinogalactan protein 21 n=1 Tax=Magnolia sinica TaxID=86752 RepID=UPI00265AB63E|nr:fasciclin-like arabinogalactan protein 21 [Magnolia sinica]